MDLKNQTVVVAMHHDGIRGTKTLHGQMTCMYSGNIGSFIPAEPAAFCAHEPILDNPHAINVLADGRETRNLVTPSSQERNIEPTKPGKV